MALSHSEKVEVRWVPRKGRGVFARCNIQEGEVIERVPVLVVASTELQNSEEWVGLSGFCFHWGRGTVALALGYGSLYNHSYQPNARYDDVGRKTKVFTAIRDIREGEEITINYNGDPADRSPVGFEVIETEPHEESSGSVASSYLTSGAR